MAATGLGENDMSHIRQFTSRVHTTPSPTITPENLKLPDPFVVCVLGASRGIGAGIALSYARAGATTIVLAARSADQLQETAKKIEAVDKSVKVIVLHCDISDDNSVKELAEAIKARAGRLDAIIANSGVAGAFHKAVTDEDPSVFLQNFTVNTVGMYYVARNFIPLLLETEGGAKQFFTINSMAAWMTVGPMVNIAYNSSKLAQARIIEMVEQQFAQKGLLTFTVHPGGVKTEMAKTAPEEVQKGEPLITSRNGPVSES